MISQLKIERFKPFGNVNVDFKPITYLFGENGIGKSSISQAILLLKQSFADEQSSGLLLNGEYVRIGNGVDALNKAADLENITFEVTLAQGEKISVVADYVAQSDILPIKLIEISGIAHLRECNVTYLSANRVGPALFSEYSHHDVTKRVVNETGSNALGILLEHGSEALSAEDPRSVGIAGSRTIKAIFDQYLTRISSGAEITLKDLSDIDSVSSTFSFTKGQELPIDSIRPTNVGFGLSYAASIIVACLISKSGDLLILENPEAHLHTKGQRAIAELLGLTAKAGIQVVCETHSREVIYHSRRLVDDGFLDPEIITFAYVQEREGEVEVQAWYPITKSIGDFNGKLDGFYDIFGGALDFIR